jgi:hypothetical protein
LPILFFCYACALKIDKPLEIKPGELRCPYCFGRDIVPSMPRGIWDAILSSLGRVPRHCRFCARRFHPRIEDVERDSALRLEAEKETRPAS